jgi:transglutaminase-like putative cysteine protease
MLLRIHHETKLSYSAPVTETVFEARMAPPTDEDQTALRYRLTIAPAAQVTSYRDGFGNRVDLFNVATPYRDLTIRATSFVRTHRRDVARRLEGVGWPGEGAAAVEALEFLGPSPLVDQSPALDEFVATLTRPEGMLAGILERLVEAVAGRLIYEKRVTTARTPLGEALGLGRGVCQDFAHLFLGACRALGLPARYVSGYVNHPGEIATHAWCQVWAGDRVGWVDVDPTARVFPGDDHVVTAVGRDYSDVPPNRGVWKGRAEESIAVTVTVEPVDRMPPEWDEWATPAPRAPIGQVQFQKQGVQAQRRAWPAYPNQPKARAGLHRQQGHQQQQAAGAGR